MLVKLVDSASFFRDTDEPQVTVIDTSTDGLVKAAADSAVTEFVSKLNPEAGKMYLHINAMGAGEYFGSNKNGDYFPEHNLKAYFKTFETSPAHVFRHHVNKDPAKAIGKVIFATYNDRMHRVELIAEVSQELGADIEAKIAQGEYPLTSMACKTPYDTCSICGNVARTRQEYCSHLTGELNTVRGDGKKVMAINNGPLRFFDISYVIRPADITSSILEKVAYTNAPAISSAQIAEEEGVMYKKASHLKTAAMKKMSELIKVVDDGVTVDTNGSLSAILEKVRDPSNSLIATLAQFEWSDIFNSMAEAGVNPSIRFMSELVMQKFLGDRGAGLGEILAEFIMRVHPAHIPAEEAISMFPEIDNKAANPILRGAIARMIGDVSLSSQYVEKRASYGYASWDGHMNPEPPYLRGPMLSDAELQLQMQRRGMVPEQGRPDDGLLKTLLVMGGMAIASRFYISSLMDEKFQQLENNALRANQAKLGIVKSAEAALSDLSTSLIYQNASVNGSLLKVAEFNAAGKPESKHVPTREEINRGLTAAATTLLEAPSSKAQLAGKALLIAKKLNHSD